MSNQLKCHALCVPCALRLGGCRPHSLTCKHSTPKFSLPLTAQIPVLSTSSRCMQVAIGIQKPPVTYSAGSDVNVLELRHPPWQEVGRRGVVSGNRESAQVAGSRPSRYRWSLERAQACRVGGLGHGFRASCRREGVPLSPWLKFGPKG